MKSLQTLVATSGIVRPMNSRMGSGAALVLVILLFGAVGGPARAHTVWDAEGLVAGSCAGSAVAQVEHSLVGTAVTWGCGASARYLRSSFVISGRVVTSDQGWSSMNQVRIEGATTFIAATHRLAYLGLLSPCVGSSAGH